MNQHIAVLAQHIRNNNVELFLRYYDNEMKELTCNEASNSFFPRHVPSCPLHPYISLMSSTPIHSHHVLYTHTFPSCPRHPYIPLMSSTPIHSIIIPVLYTHTFPSCPLHPYIPLMSSTPIHLPSCPLTPIHSHHVL